MLDLQTRVHLEEIEIVSRIRNQKLDRARAGVVHGFSNLHRSVTHALPQLRIVYR
jgi:hypothetical protein